MRTRLIGLLLLFCVMTSIKAADRVTVLAIGDSITEGSSKFHIYREFLVSKLKKEGSPFVFIGPKEDGFSAHAGFGGKNTAYLNQKIGDIYKKYPADLILLHSGHNSFSKDKPVMKIIQDTESIIQKVNKINPKVKVLLAKVICSGKLPKYSYIPELNIELGKLAKKMNANSKKVILVDQAKGFIWEEDTIADKVHPNKRGAKKMAEKWYSAMMKLN